LGFEVRGFGVFGFGVLDFGFWISGFLSFEVWGRRFGVLVFRGLGVLFRFGVWGFGFEVWGSFI
jgi:hypothetical protein